MPATERKARQQFLPGSDQVIPVRDQIKAAAVEDEQQLPFVRVQGDLVQPPALSVDQKAAVFDLKDMSLFLSLQKDLFVIFHERKDQPGKAEKQNGQDPDGDQGGGQEHDRRDRERGRGQQRDPKGLHQVFVVVHRHRPPVAVTVTLDHLAPPGLLSFIFPFPFLPGTSSTVGRPSRSPPGAGSAKTAESPSASQRRR